jgi:class 3 adenylate cyclase/tetratricopeptide (TPR) repeat protein
MATRVVERRIVTVLFADLVGFTSLSERLDAEDVSLVQDAYFEAVRLTIERHGGMLEKFVGDAAMAVFGAPRVRDDDAERAVRAGLALVAAVDRLGSSLGLDEGALRLRVGVNTGEAVYGEATAERGPVTGDTVNVAARLQAAADPGSVVVGGVTALAVADAVELEPAGELELKGKADSVAAWLVLGVYRERSRERALGGLRAPMIGRNEELERLISSLGDGSKRIVVVAPPGVGKTRLLEECGVEADRRGAAVLRARLRPDLLSPFEPVGQLVRSLGDPAEVVTRLPRGRGEVVREALAAVIAPVEAASGFAEERNRLFAAWLEGLDALAAGAPAAWLVEDVHWASPDLLAFLDLAGRASGAPGRLVIGTTRPALLESAAEWCAGGEVLHLEPLPKEEAAELVRGLVGDALPPDLVARIAETSGGNALFVEELLRTWVSTGVLEREPDGGWTLAADAQAVALPPTVQAIYAGQLDDLPARARTAARRSAVAGRRFPFAALQPLNVEDAEEAVATLERRALVGRAADDPVLGPSYVYRHALLRDAGYASLARGERATLHVRLADWLAGLSEDALPTLAEVIARHYAAALESAPSLAREIDDRSPEELRATAAEWFGRASDIAARFAAWESARTLAERSVELTHEQRPLMRAQRLERFANATANTVGVDEAERLLREAIELYRSVDQEEVTAVRAGIASAGASLGYLLRAQTRFAEAEQLATAMLEEIGAPDDAAAARLLLLRSVSAMNARDDFESAEVDARRALEIVRAAGEPTLELDALDLTTSIRAERGDDVTDSWMKIEELARRAGRWEIVASTIRTRAFEYLDDEPDRAIPLIDEAAEVVVAHGLLQAGGMTDYVRAEAHFSAGRWDNAIESGLRAIELGETHDYHRVVVRSWFVLLPIASAQRREDLARQAYPRFEARRGKEPDSPYARIVATAAHLHLAAAGLEVPFVPEVEERMPSFDLDHGSPSWLAGIETVVGSWLDAGDHDGAQAALDRMRARLQIGRASGLARGVEGLLRARLFLACGDADHAAAEANGALAVLRAPWWRAKAIRVLDEAGAAEPSHLDEARSIKARLALAP